jgi:hypothetical protein
MALKIKFLFFLLLLSSANLFGEALRLKDFRQILTHLQQATNVLERSDALKSYYLSRISSLPKTGSLEEITPHSIQTTIGLSSFLCEQMVLKDMKLSPEKRWAHQFINFNLPPSQALSILDRGELIKNYAQLFWLRDPASDEIKILDLLIQDLMASFPDVNNSFVTILTATCVSVAASFESQLSI